MKILIVEDEKDLVESISDYLAKQGYLCETSLNFENANSRSNLYDYDFAIVDITLPDGNGLNIVKMIKERSPQTGIIIISAKNSLDDRIKGLGLGADDYITKPFYLSELNARLSSLKRRIKFEGNKEIIFDDVKIIPEEAKVSVSGQTIDLTKKEYDLLIYLISNVNKVLTKEAIAEHLWGEDVDSLDSFDFVYTHMKNLRKKIQKVNNKDYVKTLYGLGYKFTLS